MSGAAMFGAARSGTATSSPAATYGTATRTTPAVKQAMCSSGVAGSVDQVHDHPWQDWLAQVQPWFGASEMLFWRRWDPVLAQVRFLVGDLRHESCAHALPWRRSHLFFHTCTSVPHHLRQHTPLPAPAYPITCSNIPHHLLQHTPSPAPAWPVPWNRLPHHLSRNTSSLSSDLFGGHLSTPWCRWKLCLAQLPP